MPESGWRAAWLDQLGQKITASAMPKFFSSSNESMYFTWYIKHNATGGDDGKGNIDWNGSGELDIEDYKIEAMKIIATNGYRQEKADYQGNKDDDKDGFGTLESFVQNGIITDEDCQDLGLPEDECKQGLGVREKIKDICPEDSSVPREFCTKAPFGGFNAKKPTWGIPLLCTGF